MPRAIEDLHGGIKLKDRCRHNGQIARPWFLSITIEIDVLLVFVLEHSTDFWDSMQDEKDGNLFIGHNQVTDQELDLASLNQFLFRLASAEFFVRVSDFGISVSGNP
jgi:hypothetical protein